MKNSATNLLTRHLSIRAFHTVKAQGASTAVFEECENLLNYYLDYYKEKKTLRNLVYRPKNASALLSKEIYNAEKGYKYTPKVFNGTIKGNTINKMIINSENYENLQKVQKLIVDLAKFNPLPVEKHILKDAHFINLLIQGAKLNKFPHVLTFLYNNKGLLDKFTTESTVAFINVLNGIFKINALQKKNLDTFVSSLYVPISNLLPQEKSLADSPLANLSVIASLINFKTLNPDTAKYVNPKIQKLNETLDLSKISIDAESLKKSNFKSPNHQFKYVILKNISEQVSQDAELKSRDKILATINPYVSKFESFINSTELNLNDQIKKNSVFSKPVAEQPAVEEPASEEPAAEEQKSL